MAEIYICPKLDCNNNVGEQRYFVSSEIDIVSTVTGSVTGAITGTIVADSIPGPAVPG